MRGGARNFRNRRARARDPAHPGKRAGPRKQHVPVDGVGIQGRLSVQHKAPHGAGDGTMNAQWARDTSDNVNITATVHRIATPAVHVLKFWMVDPTVVLQNLVVDTGGLEPSYLGPPESLRLR